MGLNSVINRFISLICHQQTLRCFEIGDKTLPLCTRCTGIYAGFLIAYLFLWIISAKKRILRLSKNVIIVSLLMLFVFITDSLFSFKGILDLGNNIKFLFGLLGGASLGSFAFGILNYSLREKSYFANIYFSLKDFVYLIIVILVLFFLKLLFNYSFLFYFWKILSTLGLLFTYITVNFTLITVFWQGKYDTKFKKQSILYTFLLIIIEFFIIKLIR
ncbi:DUF2085 domain-containing protein [bacterium]|nr:DUF2085 domain-containing protein [bacterium]